MCMILMGFTWCCEVGTFRDNAELPSFFSVSCVTPGPWLSVGISTVVVVAFILKTVSMGRLAGPLLAGAPKNGHTRFPLVNCTNASLTSELVCIRNKLCFKMHYQDTVNDNKDSQRKN